MKSTRHFNANNIFQGLCFDLFYSMDKICFQNWKELEQSINQRKKEKKKQQQNKTNTKNNNKIKANATVNIRVFFRTFTSINVHDFFEVQQT